jgi:hypothetical protein
LGNLIPVSKNVKKCAKKFSSLLVQNEHNHPTDDRKLERQQVRLSVKRKATDISTRPAKIIRQTLQETDEWNLIPVSKNVKKCAKKFSSLLVLTAKFSRHAFFSILSYGRAGYSFRL